MSHRWQAALVASACALACGGEPQRRLGPATPGERRGAVAGQQEPAHTDQPTPPPPPPGPVLEVPPGALDGIFAALHDAEARRPQGRALISIFGDSHTAGDRLTARLRQRLAQRFGDGGRGLVAAGKPPIRHYYQTEVRYGSSGKWQAAVGGRRGQQEPFGMAGLRLFTSDRKARAWVEPCSECPVGGRVARFELFYWTGPGAAKLRARLDEGPWRELPRRPPPRSEPLRELAGARAGELARAVIEVPAGARTPRLTVRASGAGTLALFGVALERGAPGVLVDGLGVVGRTALQLASWDWQVIGLQLAERAPSLVLLQYGTNEADYADLDLPALARAYDTLIARVRAATPGASVLVLGPPDLATRAGGAACQATAPVAEPRPQPAAEPGSQPAAEPAAIEVPPECQWHTPPRLLEIVELQRAAARRNQVAFFDTLTALGGPERMDAMVLADPPLAARDHVHLTGLGYQAWADALVDALLAAYETWQSRALTDDPPAQPAEPSR